MVSRATGWKEGQLQWSVTHDAQKGLLHLDIGLRAEQAEATKARLPVIDVKDLEAALAPAAGASTAATRVAMNWRRHRRIRPDSDNKDERRDQENFRLGPTAFPTLTLITPLPQGTITA